MNIAYYTYKNLKLYRNTLICVLLSLLSYDNNLRGQNQAEIRIANEYFLKGEKEKALMSFQALAKSQENIPLIHNNYLNLLLDLGRNKEAEDYVERQIKRDPNNLNYRLDLGFVYIRSGDLPKGDKQFKNLIKSNDEDIYRIKSIADYLAVHNLVEYATTALLQARETHNNPTLFTLELANFYRIQGNQDEMVQEYLNYVTQVPTNISYIKNLLQVLLSKPDEMESLEKHLFEKVQQNPESEVFADLLIWVNLQQKNFYGAFIQSRAYDKRFRKENSKTLEIAQVALSNMDYENADRSFSYVIKEFRNTDNYLPARLGLIRAREAKVKKSFPVNKDSVQYLIREYQNFIGMYPDNINSHEALLNEASLYAYYLDKKDSAILKLNQLIVNPKVAMTLKSKSKLELGDIYLLKEEPWESTLLYSQVEKTQRETPVGYDAKLRNAKLSYYKGDFRLAQEHLDILKQATTREIANDAMDLSMRIKENTMSDTTGAALREYASIELLLYQNKTEEAFKRIELLRKGIVNEQPISVTEILDDVYWLEANLRMKQGQFTESVALLQKILNEYGEDILSDDAYFLQGEIYQQHLKNKEKAMEIYREFLNKFPGSVYAAEARKRYRMLRGDFVEGKTIN